jgi:hypothetical protein
MAAASRSDGSRHHGTTAGAAARLVSAGMKRDADLHAGVR